MTAFNCLLDKNFAIISMDTLASDSISKEPLKFVSKIHFISHINCIICGTGSLDVIYFWINWVNKHNVMNINDLNHLAENDMPNILYRYKDKTTIYQFGFDEESNELLGFAYRNEKNYKSEKMKYSFCYKPTEMDNMNPESIISGLEDNIKNNTIEEFLFNLMKKQKEYDDKLPKNKKVGIGGICQILILQHNGFNLINYKKFDDYDKVKDKFVKSNEIL